MRRDVPVRRALQPLQVPAARPDAPELAGPVWNVAREHDRLAVRREDRLDLLAPVVMGELSQQSTVLAKQIKMGVTRGSFRQKVAYRHHDLGRRPRGTTR